MLMLPNADKLTLRKGEEDRLKSMIIDALLAIQNGQNPRVIESMLQAYIQEGKREVAGE
jgi:chemotaxis protein MotA